MFKKCIKILVELFLLVPHNIILDKIISQLLDYAEEGPIRTRYGFYIHF